MSPWGDWKEYDENGSTYRIWRQEMNDERRELIEQARRERKVIRHNSLIGAFCWTPDRLKQENADGSFCFSVDNFRLDSVDNYLSELQDTRDDALRRVATLDRVIKNLLRYKITGVG